MSKFCTKCGNTLPDNATFCPKCGAQMTSSVNGGGTQQSASDYNGGQTNNGQSGGYQAQYAYNPYASSTQVLVQQLSKKVKTDAIIWLIIGGLQILWGLIWLVVKNSTTYKLGIIYDDYWTGYATDWLWTMIVGGLNIYYGISNLKYSGQLLAGPTIIIAKYQNLVGYVLNIIYNAIFGGIIGIIGGIYALTIRSFVLRNRPVFEKAERGEM